MLRVFKQLSQWIGTGPPAFAIRPLYHQVELVLWNLRGRRGPIPHPIKERVVLDHARRHHLDVLVESGTYLGDMVWAVRHDFRDIHSVELEPMLYRRATRRFRRFRHVHLYEGDSGQLLQKIAADLGGPALFWLDGHYSGGITAKGEVATPVMKELDDVFGDSRHSHVVLIDDAGQFVGSDDYPSLEQLQAQIDGHGARVSIRVADNIIRIEPLPAVS